MAYQKNPESIIWLRLNDGTLLSCTYEPKENVKAWAKHLLGPTEGGEASVGSYPTLQPATPQENPNLTHATPISSFDDLVTYFAPQIYMIQSCDKFNTLPCYDAGNPTHVSYSQRLAITFKTNTTFEVGQGITGVFTTGGGYNHTIRLVPDTNVVVVNTNTIYD